MSDVIDRIRAAVERHPVLIFMKGTPAAPECGFSAATVEVLDALGVPFEAVDVLQDPELREGIKQFSQWPTIPQVFVGGQFVGGCDIVREMYESGELEPLVHAAVRG